MPAAKQTEGPSDGNIVLLRHCVAYSDTIKLEINL